MTEKMTLLFLKLTNQILAAITRVALPEGSVPKGNETEDQKKQNEAAELKVLVGEQLVVRDLPVKLVSPLIAIPQFIKTGISFHSTDLGVMTTDLDAAVLLDSREYFINSDQKPQLGFDPGTVGFHVTATEIKITLPSAVNADTGVWVQVNKIGGNLEPQTLTSVIKQSDPDPHNKTASISAQLDAGSTYQFLTLVAGYKPIIYEQPV